ncbi:MAG: TauD/TfdA family dioxygenase [Chloroflexota bacterium]|nr:TauD/TfdA family dioxygenase [Chloroflexota bacterium]
MVSSSLADPRVCAGELLERGFVYSRARHADKPEAWEYARKVFAAATEGDSVGMDMPQLEVVGEFSVPPAGALRRDFQTLHIDFGLPVAACEALDIARFTALYVDSRHPATTAVTRVVPLRALLGQRGWPDRRRLLANLRRYGRTDRAGASYVEGILARLVEAADDCSALPSTAEASFLCGMEFASVAEERAHFTRHGLELDSVEHRILLSPGELLLFDNLATAHGRVGKRRPEELQQRCVGYRGLDVTSQHTLLHRVLDAFPPRTNRREPRAFRG